MTARQLIIDTLEAQVGAGLPLEGVDVIGYASNITPPARPVVMVRIDEVTPSQLSDRRSYTFALILIPSQTEPGPADEELDQLLEDVLYAIDQADTLTWTRALRATYQNSTYPAYEVIVTRPIGISQE